MTQQEILKTVWVKYPREWEFISKTLGRETIDEIASSYEDSENSEFERMCSELGLEMIPRNIPEECMHFLYRKASKAMWRGISKDQANAMLKAMYSVNAVSIKMANGADYTTREIIESWKYANENLEPEKKETLSAVKSKAAENNKHNSSPDHLHGRD